ncbi:hypothetical protein [Thermasporomyces composti]|jgi:hypothetical protein|uniref:Uncharacterized protein n=1 Tax=Thermasporomyces composti TaxID=696763 RepID=A0A3D9VFH9_THECX|nr:hypothetical protein [Thermasporomyces composti]REF37905.1 hypothetical protein DFJ64_3366 [Thermasporomyces composti]
MLLKILLVIAIIWLALALIGFIIKGLLWLGIIAAVLFVATSLWGWIKRNT